MNEVIVLPVTFQAGDIYEKGVDGLEILSNLLEGNPNSPELPYYGTLQIYARHLIGYAPEPLNKNKAIPAASEHYETTLRDPASWRFFKWLLNFYDDYYSHVEPYTQKQLECAGVNIDFIDVEEIVTYFDYFDSDVGQYYGTAADEDLSILIRQRRLNHLPWTYNISAFSKQNQQVLVKVFLGPKYDRFGQVVDIKENNDKFYLVDHFSYNIKQGHNLIVRNNEEALGSDRTSYSTLIGRVRKALRGEEEFVIDGSEAYWSFPRRYKLHVDLFIVCNISNLYRLLLPKGTIGGMKFQLYVILTPIPDIDKTITSDGVYKRVGTGRHSGLSLRFPLDRKIGKSFSVPNSFIVDVTVRHEDKLKH